jgi:formate hydrogenlyase subunit 3/multisubunit Na+/H+ antiporter MnhD subunit
MFGTMRRNAVIWLGGILLICGTPPSPLFVTEFALFASAPGWIGLVVAILLFTIFAGMTMAALRMNMGETGTIKCPEMLAARAERLWLVPAVMCIAAAVLGFCLLWMLNGLWSI